MTNGLELDYGLIFGIHRVSSNSVSILTGVMKLIQKSLPDYSAIQIINTFIPTIDPKHPFM